MGGTGSGNPPAPAHLKLLRGNPGKRQIAPEMDPLAAPEVPPPPAIITSEYAREEWNRVAPELWRLRCLRITDYMPLAAYCVAYGQWRDAEEALARMRAGDPVMFGLVVKSKKDGGTPIENPLVKASRKAADQMVRYASQFGFTPAARARIAAGLFAAQPPPKGKFDGLLAS
jgi:P27 family predicted phage terminase small subunit